MNIDPRKLYQIEKKLGSGGFGEVYKARNKQTGDTVAIKTVQIARQQDFAGVAKEVSHLLNCQSKYIIKMMDKPYLVGTRLSFGSCYYHCWIVLEYCSGGSIEKYIKKCDERLLNQIMHNTLAGLIYLHSKNIIHRDIKPHNILYDPKSKIFKLGDLGIAKNIAMSVAKTAIGTQGYVAPEIATGKYTNKVDIYSWGVTINHLAAKQSYNLNAIIGACCQFQPNSRPSAQQLYTNIFQKKGSKK